MFSGIGGFELGLQRSCIENKRQPKVLPLRNTKGQSKQQPYRSTERFTCIGYSEINKYAIQVYQKHFPTHKNYGDATKLNTRDLPDFDFLVAGFPCQAFSIAGKRKGFQDTRGTLFFEIARIAKEKQPSILFLENVKGLLNHNKGKTFETILKTLDELGYDAEWQVLNSKYFVPQNRERVFIIGHKRGQPFRRVFSLGNKVGVDKMRCYQVAKISTRKFESSGRIYSFKGLARALKAESGDKTGTYLDNNKVRYLTPLECERLQGFPEGWTKGQPKTTRWKQLGNAVTIPVIEYILRGLTK